MAVSTPVYYEDVEPQRTWRSWHLVAIFAVGSIIAWVGDHLKDWAGDKLKKVWFPEDPEEEDPTPEAKKRV